MRKGFTLLELIIVVIVIGILAMVAAPQFFRVAERGRVSEALSVLGALRNAQLRYAAEHSLTANNCSFLDVEPTNLKFFNYSVNSCFSTDPAAGNDTTVIASLQRNNFQNMNVFGNYVLNISVDGNITCAGGSTGACRRIGY